MDNYILWDNWNHESYPTKNTEQWKFLAQAGRLASNIHNSQPDRYRISGDKLILSPNPTYHLPHSDPSNYNLWISLGCAYENMYQAAIFHQTTLTYEIDSEKKEILITKSKSKVNDKLNLATEITKRFSNKKPYSDKTVEKELLNQLLKLNENKDVNVSLLTNINERSKIIDLHLHALLNTPNKTITEIGGWLRNNNTKRSDGMPGFVSGLNNSKVALAIFACKYFPKVAKKQIATGDKIVLNSSPVFGLITSKNNSINNCFESGRTYQKLALFACKVGLAITPMQAMIENIESHDDLLKFFGSKGFPRMFFRLGYPQNQMSPTRHTPRGQVVIS